MRAKSSSIVAASLLAFALFGCSPGSRKLESKIARHIEKCFGTRPCTIVLGNITSFDWDRFYAFKYTASQSDREKAMGVPDPHFKELMRQIIFLKAGQIVYQESEPTNVEHPIKNEVIFDIPDDSSFKVYSRNTRFAVSKQDGEDGKYYLLKQVP